LVLIDAPISRFHLGIVGNDRHRPIPIAEELRGKSTGPATVRIWVQIQALVGPCSECKLLTYTLVPTPPTSLRLRRSVK